MNFGFHLRCDLRMQVTLLSPSDSGM